MSNELKFIEKQIKMDNKDFKMSINVDDELDKSIINTRDNLKSEVLNNIINIIGLRYNEAMKSKSIYIDNDLLNSRNTISHGSILKLEESRKDNDVMSFEKVIKLKDIIMAMMDYFSIVIMEYAENEYYLKEKADERNKFETEMGIKLEQKLKDIEKKEYKFEVKI